MHPWLLKMTRNLRFSHEISRTKSHVAQLRQVERAYVLLGLTLFKGAPGSSDIHLALNNPFSFTREEIVQIYCELEGVRNENILKFGEMQSFYKVLPKELKNHAQYMLHSINVLMTTLASALIDKKLEQVRLMWQYLASSHDKLPEALAILLECMAMQEKLGNQGRSAIAFTDGEWIERAQWVPSMFLPQTIEPFAAFSQKPPAVKPQSGASLVRSISISEAAADGDAESQFKVGSMYLRGDGGPKDNTMATIWLRQAANQGHSEAQKLLHQLAEQGDAESQCALGWMYIGGCGVPKDSVEAAKWFHKAADQGLAIAQNRLGVMYQDAEGVPQDSAESLKWHLKAAEQGNVHAQCVVGAMFGTGEWGVGKDDVEAVKWLRKAAEQGNADAQCLVGRMYFEGENGVCKDRVEAEKWLRKSAEQGNVDAQYFIGAMYFTGDGGLLENNIEAVKWLRKAAEQSSVAAQSLLGSMFANGEGVPKDFAEAVKWYRMAAEQGNKEAQDKLTLICAQNNDTLNH